MPERNVIYLEEYQFKGYEVSKTAVSHNKEVIKKLEYLPLILADYVKVAKPQHLVGFEIVSHSINNMNFYCLIDPGGIIINHSLLFIKDSLQLTLSLNQNWPLTDGTLIIDICYRPDITDHTVSVFLVDPSGNIYPSNTYFNVDYDHVIIGYLKIKEINGIYTVVNETLRRIRYPVNILGKPFFVYGYVRPSSPVTSSGIIITSIIGQDPIVVNQNDESTVISLGDIDNATLSYTPTYYAVADNRLVSHLQAIDQKLGQLLGTDVIIEDDAVGESNGTKYVILNYPANVNLYHAFRVHIMSGVILYPDIDFTYDQNNNRIIFNSDVPLEAGEEVTIIYYTR